MPTQILLTGASGYIGSRLLRVLEEAGCVVRCLARHPERVAAGRPTTEVVAADCLDEASLAAAMNGVDQAFYLVHSMASGSAYATRDREAAANFGRAAARAGVRRIIYLGGLGDNQDSLSTHLKSRMETGEALREAGVPTVEFRASIVVGAGSLSFEMIRALVERLPVMICPRWVDSNTQPIAIDDVLAYLRAALDLPESHQGVFEIGGPEVVSYGDMMREYATLRGLRRLLIPIPVLTPRLSGLWLGLVTPAHARVGRALVEGLRNPTVVRSAAALETFAVHPMTLRQAFLRAIDEAPGRESTFTYASIIGAPAADVFRWHEQPAALAALTPPGLVRLEQQEGGIRDGGRVTVSIGFGWARVRWTMRHYGYIAGRRFCDEQVVGPFAVWRHEHLFEPIGPAQTRYEDRIAFAVARGAALNAVAAAVLRPVLSIAFALRHRVVRRSIGRASPRAAGRAAALALVIATTLQTGAAQTPTSVRTVRFVDLERYAGQWFEIARFPNRFQRECVGDVRATYARRPDGRVDVLNRCRTAKGETEARGVARIVDEQTFARLKVRFAPGWLSLLPLVWGDYWIIGLAPDYSWAVVGDPGRDYLWILSRTPQLDDQRGAAARSAARDNGFDVKRLVLTPQTRAVSEVQDE